MGNKPEGRNKGGVILRNVPLFEITPPSLPIPMHSTSILITDIFPTRGWIIPPGLNQMVPLPEQTGICMATPMCLCDTVIDRQVVHP
jgi:hypothetical protein